MDGWMDEQAWGRGIWGPQTQQNHQKQAVAPAVDDLCHSVMLGPALALQPEGDEGAGYTAHACWLKLLATVVGGWDARAWAPPRPAALCVYSRVRCLTSSPPKKPGDGGAEPEFWPAQPSLPRRLGPVLKARAG